MSKFFSLLTFVVFFSVASGAAENHWQGYTINRQSKVTYEQWTYLLRLKVSEIQDLQSLWETASKDLVIERIYFGGGALRSLLHWLDEQLMNYSFEEVKKLPAPAISDLVLPNADRDIFLRKNMGKEEFLELFPDYANWDVLNPGFLRESVDCGGSAIEKVGVNPYEIYDPFNAIRDFYQGIISYIDVPDDQFKPYRGLGKNVALNSKIALLIRHLRFNVLFGRTALTNKEREGFRQIVNHEGPLLKVNNYWVKKSLKKLEQEISAQRYKIDILKNLLEETGVMKILISLGYDLNYDVSLMSLYKDEPLDLDYKKISERASRHHNFYLATDTIYEALKHVRSFDDLADLLSPPPGAAVEWETQVLYVLKENSKILQRVLKNIDEVQKFKKRSNAVDFIIYVIEMGIPLAKSARDFINLLDPGIEHPSDLFNENLRGLWLRKLREFVSLKPTPTEVNIAKRRIGTIDGIRSLLRLAAKDVKSVAELTEIFSPEFKNPPEAYSTMLASIWEEHMDLLFKLNPTAEEIVTIKRQIRHIPTLTKIMSRYAKNSRDADAIIKVVSSEIRNPTEDYIRELQRVWTQIANHFASLNPSPGEISRAIMASGLKAEIENAIHKSKQPSFFKSISHFWASKSKRSCEKLF